MKALRRGIRFFHHVWLPVLAASLYAQGQGFDTRPPPLELPEFTAWNEPVRYRDCRAGGKDRVLPPSIGSPGRAERLVHALPCDTMVVPEGSTTVVHANTMLHFTNPTLNSMILVKGELLLKGNKDAQVYLSAAVDTLDRFKQVYEPEGRNWTGIEVSQSGRLEMRFSVMVGAPTPVIALSPRVLIENCLFKGSSGMFLPNGELYGMDPGLHSVAKLDMAEGGGAGEAAAASKPAAGTKATAESKPADVPSKAEKEKLFAEKRGFWTASKVWGGMAVIAAVGGGTGLYLWYKDARKDPPPTPSGAYVNPIDDPNNSVLPFPSGPKR